MKSSPSDAEGWNSSQQDRPAFELKGRWLRLPKQDNVSAPALSLFSIACLEGLIVVKQIAVTEIQELWGEIRAPDVVLLHQIRFQCEGGR
jgi:hypothetical protein